MMQSGRVCVQVRVALERGVRRRCSLHVNAGMSASCTTLPSPTWSLRELSYNDSTASPSYSRETIAKLSEMCRLDIHSEENDVTPGSNNLEKDLGTMIRWVSLIRDADVPDHTNPLISPLDMNPTTSLFLDDDMPIRTSADDIIGTAEHSDLGMFVAPQLIPSMNGSGSDSTFADE